MVLIILAIMGYPVVVWLCGFFLVKSVELTEGSKCSKEDKEFLINVSWFWPFAVPAAVLVFVIVLTSRWMKSWL